MVCVCAKVARRDEVQRYKSVFLYLTGHLSSTVTYRGNVFRATPYAEPKGPSGPGVHYRGQTLRWLGLACAFFSSSGSGLDSPGG